MLFQNITVALSFAAVSMARVSQPQIRSEGAVCFDAGDCLLVCHLTVATSEFAHLHQCNSPWRVRCRGTAATDPARTAISWGSSGEHPPPYTIL